MNESERAQSFREGKKALADGKIIVVVFDDGRRDFLDSFKGSVQEPKVETQGGIANYTAGMSFVTFDNCREAQNYVFEKVAA